MKCACGKNRELFYFCTHKCVQCMFGDLCRKYISGYGRDDRYKSLSRTVERLSSMTLSNQAEEDLVKAMFKRVKRLEQMKRYTAKKKLMKCKPQTPSKSIPSMPVTQTPLVATPSVATPSVTTPSVATPSVATLSVAVARTACAWRGYIKLSAFCAKMVFKKLLRDG